MNRWTCLALLIILMIGVSCHRQVKKNVGYDRFECVTLPQVRYLYEGNFDDPRSIWVMIDTNGSLSIARTRLRQEVFGEVIRLAVERGGASTPVLIGADVSTSFDSVWPALLACRSNGIASVRFAVTDAAGQELNAISIFLPRWEHEAEEGSPVVLKTNAVPTIIGVHTDSFTVAAQSMDLESIRGFLQRVQATGSQSNTIVIIPSPGITHGQMMQVPILCREAGLETICLMDAMPQQGCSDGDSSPSTRVWPFSSSGVSEKDGGFEMRSRFL